MNIATITTVKGNHLNSFILNDKDGKPVGFGSARIEGTYGQGGATKFGFVVFDKDDKAVKYAKGVDGFVKAVKSGKTKAGKDFQLEIFVEAEQFDLVKVKWQEDASLAACIDAENEIDSLFKAVKADKSGKIWAALKGLKNDTERRAKLAKWCENADWFKKAKALYDTDCPELDDSPAL